MSTRSLNKVMLLGNLTRDPELKYTPTGTAVCTLGVATNRSWTTGEGQTKEEVQYHRVVAWQKLAELSGKLLAKGRKIYLEGRIVYRTYTGKDGVQRTITEIIMDDFILFSDGKRGDSDAKSNNADESYGEPQYEDYGGDSKKESTSKNDADESISPDDIPF